MDENKDWNVPWNSELTTIKNRQYILGWITGFIAGCALIALIWHNS